MNQEIELTHYALGETRGTLSLHDQATIRAVGSHMAAQAARELRIFSRDLDAPLYDHLPFLDALRRVSLRGTHTPVRILLFDAGPAVRTGHRLVELARQLTSRILIRRVPTEFHQHTEAYLLADECGYVLRRLAEVYEGTAEFDAPLPVRRLRERFERIWDLGDTHPELRRLHI
jgi:hypothetical protein